MTYVPPVEASREHSILPTCDDDAYFTIVANTNGTKREFSIDHYMREKIM